MNANSIDHNDYQLSEIFNELFDATEDFETGGLLSPTGLTAPAGIFSDVFNGAAGSAVGGGGPAVASDGDACSVEGATTDSSVPDVPTDDSAASSSNSPRRMPPSRTGPILQRSTRYADLTDEEVADLELRDFEKVLRLSGLTKAEHKDAMARRRRVKNRFSARKSIHKKLVVKDDLLGENERLRRENIALRDQNKQLMKEALDRQRAEMEARMSSMYAELVAPELRDGGSGGPARPDVAHEA